jgi:nitroreductase
MSPTLDTDIGLADAIFHRRAVRRYTNRQVQAETVQALLRAAIQAPSTLNQQPWVFAVFHGRNRLSDYAERAKAFLIRTYPTAFETHPRSELYERPDYDLFHGANTLIVIYSTGGPLNPNEDCCLAAENLMLAAYGLGLGTCPIGFARPWFDQPETKRRLGVPEHYHAVFPLVLGYPAGFTSPPGRDEPNIVCWQWDDAVATPDAR